MAFEAQTKKMRLPRRNHRPRRRQRHPWLRTPILFLGLLVCLVLLRCHNHRRLRRRHGIYFKARGTTTPNEDYNTKHLPWTRNKSIQEIRLPTIVKQFDKEKLEEHSNRTLVILIGDLRCGEPAWESLQSNVLDYFPNNNKNININKIVDLALLIHAPIAAAYQNASLLQRSIHTELVPPDTDWADVWDLIYWESRNENNDGNIIIKEDTSNQSSSRSDAWRQTVFRHYPPSTHPALLGGMSATPTGNDTPNINTNYVASGAIVNGLKWMAHRMIKKQGWDKNNYYERVLVTRTDQYYLCPLDIDEIMGSDDSNQYEKNNDMDSSNTAMATSKRRQPHVWVPQGEDYGGINDRFVLFRMRDVDAVLNPLPRFLHNPLAFQQTLEPEYDWLGRPHRVNCEKFLLYLWQAQQVHVHRPVRHTVTCAAPAHDASRWGHAQMYAPEIGVHLKYPKEYPLAQTTCRRRL